MTLAPERVSAPVSTPLWLRLTSVVGFAALIALCAQIAVPMIPVPMTLQTWAVLLAGAALGPRWGVAVVTLYLAGALIGLPVLSDGASGLAPFKGATAGYLVAFLPAAGLAGWLSRSRRLEQGLPATGWMIGLHLLILTGGGAWLALSIGPGPALTHGVTPFLAGAVVKSALVVAAARGLARWSLFRPD